MLGAIIGDIVGSRFEFNNHRSKDFDLFTDASFVTDDSIMTIAIAKALMEAVKASQDPEHVDQAKLADLAVRHTCRKSAANIRIADTAAASSAGFSVQIRDRTTASETGRPCG